MSDKIQTPDATFEDLPATGTLTGNEAQKDDKTTQPDGQPQPPAAPAPKTFTEEEVNRRIETLKGGHKGTVDKMRQDIERLSSELSKAQQQALEKEYDNWLRALKEEGDGETLDLEKAIAQRDRMTRAERAEFEKDKAKVLALKEELDAAGKMKFVHETIKKYELSEDYVETLSNLDDRWEIAAKAAELALEQTKAKAVAPVKTDKGGGKPAPADVSKMSWREQAGRALAGEFD